MSKFVILNLSCLFESVVLWRHLVAIKRQGDIRLTFVADNRPMAFLSNRRIVETSTPSLLAISICFNLFLFAQHKCTQTLSFCELHHVESTDFPFLVFFYIYELFCSFLKRKNSAIFVHLFLFIKEIFTKNNSSNSNFGAAIQNDTNETVAFYSASTVSIESGLLVHLIHIVHLLVFVISESISNIYFIQLN